MPLTLAGKDWKTGKPRVDIWLANKYGIAELVTTERYNEIMQNEPREHERIHVQEDGTVVKKLIMGWHDATQDEVDMALRKQGIAQAERAKMLAEMAMSRANTIIVQQSQVEEVVGKQKRAS